MTTASNEMDEFWQIALNCTGTEPHNLGSCEHSGDDDECMISESSAGRCTDYKVMYSSDTRITLKLSPLPLSDGIWSPLGSEAWYGSALLAALLLRDNAHPGNNMIQNHLESCYRKIANNTRGQEGYCISALELGSGAVGLSGLCLALLLAKKQGAGICSNVVLTDNDHKVLRQLQVNVRSNVNNIQRMHPDIDLPAMSVEHLDWGEAGGATHHISDANNQFRLIVGSELIYTRETGRACASIVARLVRRNPDALVVIVQVRDRDGWSNTFLPSMEQQDGFFVREEALVDADIHEAALRMIRHGGTLDRFDFGVCYISMSSK